MFSPFTSVWFVKSAAQLQTNIINCSCAVDRFLAQPRTPIKHECWTQLSANNPQLVADLSDTNVQIWSDQRNCACGRGYQTHIQIQISAFLHRSRYQPHGRWTCRTLISDLCAAKIEKCSRWIHKTPLLLVSQPYDRCISMLRRSLSWIHYVLGWNRTSALPLLSFMFMKQIGSFIRHVEESRSSDIQSISGSWWLWKNKLVQGVCPGIHTLI